MLAANFLRAILSALGLVGDYVARIYEEVKGRPLYVVSEVLNVGPRLPAPPRAVCLARPVDTLIDPQDKPNNGTIHQVSP